MVTKWNKAADLVALALASKEYNETSDELTHKEQTPYFCDVVSNVTLYDGAMKPYYELWEQLNTTSAFSLIAHLVNIGEASRIHNSCDYNYRVRVGRAYFTAVLMSIRQGHNITRIRADGIAAAKVVLLEPV